MSKAVIVAASRTPTGKFLGALSDVKAVELGAAPAPELPPATGRIYKKRRVTPAATTAAPVAA